jgi:hypothetical protein
MSFSYDPSEADNISKVRGKIGDTDQTVPRFQDETITARLLTNNSNPFLAAADLLDTILTVMSSGPSEVKFADYQEKQGTLKDLRDRITELKAQSGQYGNWERWEVSDYQLPRWPQDIGAGMGPTGGNY